MNPLDLTPAPPLRGAILACLMATFLLSTGLAASHADAQAVMSPQEIAKRLKAAPPVDDDEDAPLSARALGRKPDPITRLCEPRPPQNAQGRSVDDNAFRNLVAVPSPKVDLSVEFEFAKAVLNSQGIAQLDALAEALNDPKLKSDQFTVTGHTDAVGTVDANDRLSCERALAAKRHLTDKRGIQADRLITLGMGSSRLAVPGDPRHAANRRVEIKVMPLK